MGSSGFSAQPREVLPQRGMAFAHHHSVCPGSKMTITAPSRGPPKTACLRGKSPGCPGSAPFGGRNGLVWVAATRSTATTGARALAQHHGGAGTGSRKAIIAPSAVPGKDCYAGEKAWGPGSASFGAGRVSLPSRQSTRGGYPSVTALSPRNHPLRGRACQSGKLFLSSPQVVVSKLPLFSLKLSKATLAAWCPNVASVL
jgi:hypothetical protein